MKPLTNLITLLALHSLGTAHAEQSPSPHCACSSHAEVNIKRVDAPNVADGFVFTGSINGEDVVTAKPTEVPITQASRATVIAFLSAKCPCSASHETALKKLFEEFSPRGVQFIAIHSNLDEACDFTKAHFEKSAFPFPVIQDRSNQFADTFGALKTPHIFVIGPKGAPLFQGGIDDSHNESEAKKHYLKDALTSIAEGKAPPLKSVRTLGCVIKR